MNAVIALVFFLGFAMFVAWVSIGFIKYIRENTLSETEERIHEAYDSYFYLLTHLKESDNPKFVEAAKKLDGALNILIEVEQMVQEEDSEDNQKQ